MLPIRSIRYSAILLSLFVSLVSCGSDRGMDQSGNQGGDTKLNHELLQNSSQGSAGTDKSAGGKARVFSKGKQEVLKIMLKSGPDSVLRLDCSKYDDEGKAFCDSEKSRISQTKSEVTWESVMKKGAVYVKTFNCSEIKQDVGKRYCEKYKKGLPNDPQGKDTGISLPKQFASKNPYEGKDCDSLTKSSEKVECIHIRDVTAVTNKLNELKQEEKKKFDCKKFSSKAQVDICAKYVSALK